MVYLVDQYYFRETFVKFMKIQWISMKNVQPLTYFKINVRLLNTSIPAVNIKLFARIFFKSLSGQHHIIILHSSKWNVYNYENCSYLLYLVKLVAKVWKLFGKTLKGSRPSVNSCSPANDNFTFLAWIGMKSYLYVYKYN